MTLLPQRHVPFQFFFVISNGVECNVQFQILRQNIQRQAHHGIFYPESQRQLRIYKEITRFDVYKTNPKQTLALKRGRDWGMAGVAGRALAAKVGGPEFRSSEPHKRQA